MMNDMSEDNLIKIGAALLTICLPYDEIKDTRKAERAMDDTGDLLRLLAIRIRKIHERLSKDAEEATEYVLAVENRELRAEVEMLSKTVKQHEATLEEVKDMSFNAPELNMNNYDDAQVRELNDAMIAIWRLL